MHKQSRFLKTKLERSDDITSQKTFRALGVKFQRRQISEESWIGNCYQFEEIIKDALELSESCGVRTEEKECGC